MHWECCWENLSASSSLLGELEFRYTDKKQEKENYFLLNSFVYYSYYSVSFTFFLTLVLVDVVAADGASDSVACLHLQWLLAQLDTVKSGALVSGTCPGACWDSDHEGAWEAGWSYDTCFQVSWPSACVGLSKRNSHILNVELFTQFIFYSFSHLAFKCQIHIKAEVFHSFSSPWHG